MLGIGLDVLHEQRSFDDIADVTAVLPPSQITFEITAAHFTLLPGNNPAPIPQSALPPVGTFRDR